MIEREAFEQHFRQCFEPLSRYAFAFIKDREQSKEIVQEVFVALWEKRRTLIVTSSLRIYLYQAVKNKSLNHLRACKKTVFVSELPEEIADEDETSVPPDVTDLHKHMNFLPARCRQIFILKRIQGLSYREISLRLDISEKSVENQMTIAFKKLREGLLYVKSESVLTNNYEK